VRQSHKVMRYSLALIVSLLLLSTTIAVAAGSSSITKLGGISIPRMVTLVSLPVSTTAFQSRHSGRQLCRSVSCKRRGWLKHHPRPRYIPALKLLSLDSTAYCESGLTASEEPTHDGVVAIVKGLPLGHYYQVRSGSMTGKVLQGKDYIGHSSEFDIWMPSCGQANVYGRQHIQVAEIPSKKAKAALTHPA
jgi:hypothetical protein